MIVRSSLAAAHRPRLLFISGHTIWPPIHGSAVRMWNLIRHLSLEFEIHAFVFIGGTDDPDQRAALAPYCSDVFFQQVPPAAETDSSLPLIFRQFASPRIRDRIAALVSAHELELVLMEGSELVGLIPDDDTTPTVVAAHDLLFQSYWRRRRSSFRRFGGERNLAHS